MVSNNNDINTVEQIIQDNEYWFPYHYVTKYEPHFTQCYLDSWGINYAATIEFLLSYISKVKFNSIVDIGCGDGRFTSELSKVFPDANIVGIDYSERAINLAKAMNPGIPFIQMDITKSSTKEKYDVGILMEVLEHIPPEGVRNFLHGVSGLLCDGGVLFITVPHSNKPVEPKHFQHFTVDSLLNCLGDSFEPCKIVLFEKNSVRKRILDTILANRFFILNHRKALDLIYKYYKNRLFIACDENDCKRICMIVRKRSDRVD